MILWPASKTIGVIAAVTVATAEVLQHEEHIYVSLRLGVRWRNSSLAAAAELPPGLYQADLLFSLSLC